MIDPYDPPMHCVYPQKGARVGELPVRWRERAMKILDNWRDDGPRHQGCCCDYGDHSLLSDDDVARLSDAGFLVELGT